MSDYVSSSSVPGGTVLVTSVPSELKTLIRIIMRTFYGFELYLCMEMLLAYPCIKEEDLAELLRLESKQVHQNLVNLKKEKFVNERPIMETSGDGKQKSHSYYYINYKMMVNVIKYKLDKIRIQIETEEKQSTTRAIFKCSECRKTFSDLETKEIFFTMRCDHCGGDVEEDDSSLPSRSSRNLLAKLNTQLEIVFVLLQKLEHVRLADDILRPEPMDMSPILDKITSSSSSGHGSTNGSSGSDKTGSLANGGRGGKYESMNNMKWSDRTSKQDLFNQTRISINFETGDSSNNSANSRPLKELPSIILANQTTDESINNLDNHNNSNGSNNRALNRDSLLLNNIKKAANDTLYNSNGMYANGANGSLNGSGPKPNDSVNAKVSKAGGPAASAPAPTGTNLETIILQKLLIHEKKVGGSDAPVSNGIGSHGNDHLNRTTSFITISKKRDFESTLTPHRSESNLLINPASDNEFRDPLALKRRRLNNGG